MNIYEDHTGLCFKCPVCGRSQEEPSWNPPECVNCQVEPGSPIGCRDCDHYPIREATLRTYNSFWEKHREDLNIAETIHYMEVFL